MPPTAELERKDADPLVGLYDDHLERSRLVDILMSRYEGMLRAVDALLLRAVGLPQDATRLDDPAVRRFLLTQAATRVVRIDNTTRVALRVLLAEGQERGLSTWEIAHGTADGTFRGIDGLFNETWRSRGMTVARTELQQAQLAACIDRFQASGFVRGYRARDGHHVTSDDECSQRDGREYALENPPTILHPNCTLVIVPLINEDFVPAQRPVPPVKPITPPKAEPTAAEVRKKMIALQDARVRQSFAINEQRRELEGNINNLIGDWMGMTPGTAEHAAMQARIAQLHTELSGLHDKYFALRGNMAKDMREKFLYQTPATPDVHIAGRAKEWAEGVRAFNRLVGPGWVDDVKLTVQAATREASSGISSERSYYWDNVLHLAGTKGMVSTVVHEMGHWLEDVGPGFHEATLAFYRRRTAGESLQRMNDQPGHKGYADHELTYVDKWRHPYSGKLYQAPGHGQYATEVVSMLMQDLYENPVALAREDPDAFDWIYNMLRRRPVK